MLFLLLQLFHLFGKAVALVPRLLNLRGHFALERRTALPQLAIKVLQLFLYLPQLLLRLLG